MKRGRERERVRGERMLGTGDVAPSSLASAEEGSGKLVSKAARDEQGGHQAWDGHKSVCLYTPPRALSLSLRWGPIHKENGWLEKWLENPFCFCDMCKLPIFDLFLV